MAAQTVFMRYELKYMLTQEQKKRILEAMAPHMQLDRYGRTSIRNIYYDTDTYRLIRRSIEKPVYKEKLRLRSYGRAELDSTVFVELKKKYNRVVYKRRIPMLQKDAIAWASGEYVFEKPTQIASEITYFRQYYETLHPAVFLSYQREAFYALDASDFRVTFDDTILCRETELSLNSEAEGMRILPEDMVLMEVKCSGGIPLWMTRTLAQEKIYTTSFSKYGTAYQKIIFPRLQAEMGNHMEGDKHYVEKIISGTF